jgi:hypothetical protein
MDVPPAAPRPATAVPAGRSSGHEGAAALLIIVISTGVCGWIGFDLWQGEYVAPIVYPLAVGLTMLLVVQVRSWWSSRQST